MKKLKKNNAINLREDINLLIKNQAIERSLKSKGLKQQKCEDEIDEEKDENIERLKYFRKFGKIEEKKIQNSKINNNNKSAKEEENNNTSNINNNDKNSKYYQQFKKELEKRRYIKALRNLMIENFKEKNIIIPNICSCGQLQKKLDKIIENRNVSVYSIMNNECANNCIYYNKSQDYHKALNDIINSIKNVKFENFSS